ncbi:MAG: hypothetical protein EPGJADBJ_00351 [Saprospiraceae bacterium]|nr:hypothetical protein [Saprospiraceae bacterium]
MLTLSPIRSVSAQQSDNNNSEPVAAVRKEPSAYMKVARFLALLLFSIGANYYAPHFIATTLWVVALVAYFRSEDEGFWLAYFLVLSDGFFGFFGMYSAMLNLIPGLPGIEAGQIYIILGLVKAWGRPLNYTPFYNNFLKILLIYLVFLMVQGYVIGVSMEMNVQFRLLKWLVPLFMLYSIPRLFTRIEQYRDVFLYLFPVALAALGAQIFTIATSHSPMQHFGVAAKAKFAIKVTKEKTYRGLYNEMILLITTFGALFFLAFRPGRYFKSWYCFAIVMANFASVFLSATRGWVLSFSFATIFAMLFVLQMSARRLMSVVLIGVIFMFGAQSLPVIGIQIENAIKRLLTLEKLAEGDMSAGGTLIRLNTRGPRVMKKFEEAPLTGFGFSNEFMDHNDFHVGNQNILLHSGVIGYALMHIFFLYFMFRLFVRSIYLPPEHTYKGTLLFFCIFFPAWFMLHSSSQQFFSYYQTVQGGIIQAVFFCMGALMFEKAEEDI